jgi:hypothetical protein
VSIWLTVIGDPPADAGDRLGHVSEPVVVVGDRLDPGTAAPANLTIPCARELLRGPADEDLDGVGTFGRFGQIPLAEVALELVLDAAELPAIPAEPAMLPAPTEVEIAAAASAGTR